MPSPFKISKEDLLRSKLIPPGWYPSTIRAVTQKAAKTDGSTNTEIDLVVSGGPFDGVPVIRVFSEKAPGFAKNFAAAVLGRPVRDDGEEFDFERAVGKKIKVYYTNEKYLGRLVNRAEDFAPLTT